MKGGGDEGGGEGREEEAGRTSGGESSGNASEDATKSRRDDAKILRDLLDGGGGVSGAIDHNVIEAGAVENRSGALEFEAQRAAKAAARALQESRRRCANAPVSMPTWTGRSGMAGRGGRGRGRG